MPRRSRSRRCALPTLAILAAAIALVGATSTAHADGDGWWGELDEGQSVRLDDVIASPRDFEGRALTAVVLFHARDSIYDPMRTIFNGKSWANFSAWPDGAAVWDQGPFERDHPFFYVSRTHPQVGELLASRPFTRLELTLRIRARIRGRPAFEVISWRPTGHRMSEAVVRDVMAGDNYVRSAGPRNLELAASRYRNVLLRFPDLPPSYDMQVRRRLANVLRQLGHADQADDVEGGVPIVGGGRLPDPEQGAWPVPSPTPGSGSGEGFAPGTGAPPIEYLDPPSGADDPLGAPPVDGPAAGPADAADPFAAPVPAPDADPTATDRPPLDTPRPTPPSATSPRTDPAPRRGVELPPNIPPQRESRLAGVK